MGNKNKSETEGKTVCGKILQQTKSLALVRIDFSEVLKLYFIIRKENSGIYGAVLGVGTSRWEAFESALDFARNNEELEKIKELDLGEEQ